ncbi:Dml1p [Malassezia vespertilionis]|uniref:Dml1p n=1 Tax=Malassezia vespertilionis TaxID=2020962 RepID=A0A2N1JCN4_9BASI|nr:Dml1p [Malassezia vespertilionis]
MRAREIVHLSFGGAANHAATHFWNAQESYFEYGTQAQAPIVEHDVSFREGLGAGGAATYTPRALLFDVRSAFGALRWHSSLYDAGEMEEEREAWQGDVVHSHDAVMPSWYAAQLAEEDAGHTPTDKPQGRAIAYWSDYARVQFHPRSLVPVSALSLYGSTYLNGPHTPFDTFEQGFSVAQSMEGSDAVLDENVRWLAEDSDRMQGFQIVTDASDAFSGFAAAYLGMLQEEYGKVDRLAFAIAQETPQGEGPRDVYLRRVAAMNGVLTLAMLSESASLLVPLRTHASTAHVRPEYTNPYESSAVLSTYMETATLQTRTESLGNMVAALNWRRDTPFAQLAGCFPTPLLAPVRKKPDVADALLQALFAAKNTSYEAPQHAAAAAQAAQSLAHVWTDASFAYADAYTAKRSAPRVLSTPYAERTMARDADAMAEKPTLAALGKRNPANAPIYVHNFTPLAYPISSAYPQYFYGLTSDGRPNVNATEKFTQVNSMPTIASLRTTPDTLPLLEEARKFVCRVLTGHEPLSMFGLGASGNARAANEESEGSVGGRDGLVEIRETLENWCEAYGGVADEETPGSDEEWEAQAWDV